MSKGKPAELYQTPAQLRAQLDRPINGHGGFQSFHRDLQKNYNPRSNELALTPTQKQRIERYATKGKGGYQDFFSGLLGLFK